MRGWLFVMVLFLCTSALAQREPPNAPQLADDGGEPRVYFAHSYAQDAWDTAGLDDQVSVHVRNFGKLLEQTNKNCSEIVLFIEGFAIKDLQPISCDQVSGHVRYRLLRTKKADAVWHILLGGPATYLRTVSISVGPNENFPLPSSVTSFQLEVIPRTKLFVFFVLSLGCGLAFLWLCRRRGLIRTGSTTAPIRRRPYNLALFQMGFWFFLVMVAYLFIWMINDELDTLTDSVLALLGIGSGTALGASLIDKNKQPDAALGAPVDPGKPPETRGFLDDLLTDESGSYSLHRFQLFVWTLVLGTIFCNSVYRRLSMPEFSATLLGLMGLSSGTFLGFKVPEGKKEAPRTPDAATGAPSE